MINSRLVKAGLGLGAAVAAFTLAANAYVMRGRRGAWSQDVASLPHADAAIVLGAMVRQDGRMSHMLADRVERAAELWRAGKVDRVIASGGLMRWGHDEADVMRRALLEAAVPEEAIVTDNGGANTRATMVRARSLFEVREAIVITQEFHMPRALFLASAAGIEASGLTADLHDWGVQGIRSEAREMLARVKALAAAALTAGTSRLSRH
jgi:SanA protein